MISYVLAGISGQIESTPCARPFAKVSGPESLLVNLGGEIADRLERVPRALHSDVAPVSDRAGA